MTEDLGSPSFCFLEMSFYLRVRKYEVVGGDRRIRDAVRRGGVSPPERYNNKKSTNFAVNLSVSRAGGETPPLRTASLIYLSPTAKFLFIGDLLPLIFSPNEVFICRIRVEKTEHHIGGFTRC